MRIKWLGHAMFLITSKKGVKIVTDPFNEKIGYKMPNVIADIITVSHEHYDHNYIDGVGGSPVVFKGAVIRELCGVKLSGIASYHDNVFGTERGTNTIFVIKVDGITLCHLGDLGHLLNKKKHLDQIGKIDILFIPVGGLYTINSVQATQIVEILKPKIVIPMHYKTEFLKFSIDPVEVFLSGKNNIKILESNEFEVIKSALPEKPKIYVMNCL